MRDGTHDTPEYVVEGVPLVTSKNLTNGSIDFEDTKLISRPDHIEISKRSGVENGDVLFAMIGTVGNPLVVKTDREFSIKNVGLFKKNDPFLDSKFLKFWLDSPALQKWLEPRLKGTTQKFAPLGLLRSLPIPVAPIDQQKRIVAEIEKQFSRLDEAVANLKRLKANLKRYKAAVLKAAVEGKLTEEWRKAQTHLEPASELLKRILAERRAKWNGRGKYKEPRAVGTSEMNLLPEGWAWASIGELCFLDSGEAFKKRNYSNTGLKLFQIANVGFGKTLWEQQNFLPETFQDRYPELILEVGDVVMALNRPVLGGQLKIARIAEPDQPSILYQRVGRLRPVVREIAEYFFCFAQSEAMVKSVRERLQGTDQPYLNTSLVPDIAVPLPSLAEQNQIVAEVDRRLSIIDEVNALVVNNFNRTQRLQQGILSAAFCGKLRTSVSNKRPFNRTSSYDIFRFG